MSTAKETPCRKFQANIFNKSKCQNCFKPRELHLLTDQDLAQAKPIYGGWLCLAPEGTDFDSPMQRSRKWQRRFFVLYEHGCLRFALDESPSTLPQGTVNMNLCTDVTDAEPKTGQKNSLCIITPEQEFFIRGENKEIINGWSEQLVVYPRTNKQNQKKKRKVEPATSQEPGPAKVAVTGSGIPEADKVPDSSSIIWQEELNQREAEGASVWATADVPPGSQFPSTGECGSVVYGSDTSSVNGDEVDRGGLMHSPALQPPSDLLSPTGSCSSLGGVPRCLSPAPSDPFPSGSSLLSNGSHISGSVSSLESDASGSTVTSTDSHPTSQRGIHSFSHHDTPQSRRREAEARKAEKRSRFRSPDMQGREAILSPERSRSSVIEKLEALELENQEKMEVEESGSSGARLGRSEHRRFYREEQGLDFHSTLPPLRRAKSLDRRTTESVMTPDLLNFKKGWMVKLDEQGQWKKYWFVLTDHSLRYYKDSIAEEAADLDGEIDLSTCYNVTEYQAQRNYGFQIHTQDGVHTLSAMTAGIRRNWIQAVLKNVRPSTAPDVASSTEDHGSFSPFEGLVRPDVTQDSPSSEVLSVESTQGITKSRARERRREGRSKTFDWAEFRPIALALAQQRAQEAESLQVDLGELEQNRRRDERRKRYETVASSVADRTPAPGTSSADFESRDGVCHVDSFGSPSLESNQRVEEVIEQHWRQVEKTPICDERRVPLPTVVQTTETAELEKLLETYKHGTEDLKAQLESCHQQLLDSNKHKQELELHLRTAFEREQDIRTGYISPLEHPLGLEAIVTPQTKRPELVSPQAQSLTKKYQETKDILNLQELKKRNMQAQLSLTLLHLPVKEAYFSYPQTTLPLENQPSETIQKAVSILLQDSKKGIQELEDLLGGKTLTLTELGKVMMAHSLNEATTQKHQIHALMETWMDQQEMENEKIIKGVSKAGEIIREYEARLLIMEDLVGKVQRQSFDSLKNPYGSLSKHCLETNETTVGMLTQRVELLTNENGTLKQHCQEIVNQLTEADRELDRLKAELIGQQIPKQHHVVGNDLKRLKAKVAVKQPNDTDYERELNRKSLRLHEALVALEELVNTLNEEKLLLKEATLKGLGFPTDNEDEEDQPEKDKPEEQVKASQAKSFDTVAKLQSAEQLQVGNCELITLKQESQRASTDKLNDAENEIRMLQEMFEIENVRVGMTVTDRVEADKKQVHDEELIKQVVEVVKMKTEAIHAVVSIIAKVDVNVEKLLCDLKSTLFKEGKLPLNPEKLRFLVEEEFWSRVLGYLETKLEETQYSSWSGVTEQIQSQRRLLNVLSGMCSQGNIATEVEPKPDFASMYSWLDNETNDLILEELIKTLKAKAKGLEEIACKIMLDKDGDLLSMAQTSFCEQNEPCEYLLEALKEACMSYVAIRLNIQHEKELQLQQLEVQTCSMDCLNSSKIREVACDLQSKLADHQSLPPGSSFKNVTGPQTSRFDRSIDSLDKIIEIHSIVGRHRKELREVKNCYVQEAEKMRQELAELSETLHLYSEEKVKEIESLTSCMEKLKREHELERSELIERFDKEMEELRSMMSLVNQGRTSTKKCTVPPHLLAQPSSLKQRIQELVTQVSVMTEEMRQRDEQGDVTTLRLKYEKDLGNLKATCERGFAAMEESHQKVIDELQRKHQRELENLQEEKERLLEEETAATIAAIEAMKNAHRTELEKARKANSNAVSADMEDVHRQHEEELCSFQREIEVLSEQYSQKCLENAHLAQALEAERQALRQCQRENQELNAHNQELNNSLAAEITKMRSMTSEDGDSNTTIQGKELYELEVMLRVKVSEVQYIKQEINSLKEELQAAQRDKKYATDKYKDIYTELSIVKAKAERDLGRLKEQLQLAHEALGEPALEDVERGVYDIMKSKSNPDILKMAAAAAKRSERTLRSKSLKEGLTAEQRLQLFENKDTKEF